MTRLQENTRHYWFVFKICLLITLSFFVIFFLSWQRYYRTIKPVEIIFSSSFEVENIPVTIQRSSKKIRPARPEGMVPVLGEEDEFPEEIDIAEAAIADEATLFGEVTAASKQIPAKPIAEKYPDVDENECEGRIKLLLFINKSGRVKSCEIVENTTGSDSCLEKALAAAKQSSWLPARRDNYPVDSWVTKIYKFKKR